MVVNRMGRSRRTAAFMLLQMVVLATVVTTPSAARAQDPSSVAVITIAPRQAVNQAGTSVTFDVTAVDGLGNPWSGGIGWNTHYPYGQPSANRVGGSLYVSNGSASFSYVGTQVGEDVITAGAGVPQSNEAVAAVTWYSSSEATGEQPYIKFTSDPSGTSVVGTYASFDVRVVNQYGEPWNGYLGFGTCFYGQPSANCAGGTFYVSAGNGSFGYTGYNVGEDTLTFGKSLSTGEAVATHVWTPAVQPQPIQTPTPTPISTPTPTISPTPDTDDVPEPPSTPATEIQTWTVNIEHLLKPAWTAFATRMKTNQFGPDIILVQEVTASEASAFVQRVGEKLGNHFAFEVSSGENAVVWNTERFSKIGSSTWPQQTNGCGNGKYAVSVNLRDKAASSAFQETRNVVAASIHLRTNRDDACLEHSWGVANSALDALAPVRRMTIIGGDVNRRPDTSADEISNGLETTPDCWYQRISVAHSDVPLSDKTCGPTLARDRYYDAVWLYPGSGGGTNPTSPAFCEQFTRESSFLQPPASTNGLANSCTRFNNPAVLDRSRIDYLWLSYEDAAGVAWKPPARAIAGHIAFASADLGISLDPSDDPAQRYADHRAVQGLFTWPAAMPPPVL